LEKILKIRNKI